MFVVWGGQVGKQRKLDEKCNFCGREALSAFFLANSAFFYYNRGCLQISGCLKISHLTNKEAIFFTLQHQLQDDEEQLHHSKNSSFELCLNFT